MTKTQKLIASGVLALGLLLVLGAFLWARSLKQQVAAANAKAQKAATDAQAANAALKQATRPKPKAPPSVVYDGHRFLKGDAIALLYLDLRRRAKTDPEAARLLKLFAVPARDLDGKPVGLGQ